MCYSWGMDSSIDEDREREEQEKLNRYITCFSCCMSMCEAGGGTDCSGYCNECPIFVTTQKYANFVIVFQIRR
uniref:Uncharacterized protein n=2 Tax=Acrobeloides nanus TaxID=290746 RepID=A0A914CP10_9BILA